MPTPPLPTTPYKIDSTKALDLTLLNSSPPDGTELRQANTIVNLVVKESNLQTPVWRYIERARVAFEKTQTELILLQ
jgi:hypothetical protein